MGNARVEFSGLFLGECGCCHGSFVFTVEPARSSKPNGEYAKGFLRGKCPLCDAEIKQPVD